MVFFFMSWIDFVSNWKFNSNIELELECIFMPILQLCLLWRTFRIRRLGCLLLLCICSSFEFRLCPCSTIWQTIRFAFVNSPHTQKKNACSIWEPKRQAKEAKLTNIFNYILTVINTSIGFIHFIVVHLFCMLCERRRHFNSGSWQHRPLFGRRPHKKLKREMPREIAKGKVV